MARTEIAFVSTLSFLLLASCGEQASAGSENDAAAVENDALGNAAPAATGQPPAPAGNEAGAVPPPDAVSHPDGYLPPVPNSSEPSGPAATDSPGAGAAPATEDEYIRNKQGR